MGCKLSIINECVCLQRSLETPQTSVITKLEFLKRFNRFISGINLTHRIASQILTFKSTRYETNFKDFLSMQTPNLNYLKVKMKIVLVQSMLQKQCKHFKSGLQKYKNIHG